MDTVSMRERSTALLQKAYGRWWMMLLEGLCLFGLGAAAAFMPNLGLAVLIMIFGGYRIIMGISYIVISMLTKHRLGVTSGFSIGRGVVDLIIGGLCLVFPAGVVAFFVVIVAIWSMLFGIGLLVTGWRSYGVFRVSSMFMGAILVVFAIYSFTNPVATSHFFLIILGLILGVTGVFFIIRAFGMKKALKELKALQGGYKDYEVQ